MSLMRLFSLLAEELPTDEDLLPNYACAVPLDVPIESGYVEAAAHFDFHRTEEEQCDEIRPSSDGNEDL